MAADGDIEIDAVLARLRTLVGGRVYESALPDEANPPRLADGKIAPYIVADFGSTIRSARERNLANPEKGQPHVLPVNVACYAGNANDARKTRKAVIGLLLDWAPSPTSDAFEMKGGYGTRRPSTANTPTRFISGTFFETTVNVGVDGPW
ncbi:hypothetical protein [Microbacterium sp. zg-YB36]|uniref:hypothetical protein n=1 Tax=Microbacterium sp. zg-YB36 TaxID=2969407 RepID=UPI00214B2C8D|nr:hypothetical protein [Microbacterium sp. zg-YB36]MDL5351096.1 hypothetical protein [Microbacterium sp. zg-YB36]